MLCETYSMSWIIIYPRNLFQCVPAYRELGINVYGVCEIYKFILQLFVELKSWNS